MSRLGTQSGLVANQALSLPPETGITPEQREVFLSLVGLAGSRADVAQETPGLIGQAGARTEQLLSAPLTPTPVRTSGGAQEPLAPASLNRLAAGILERRSVPGPLEQIIESGNAGLLSRASPRALSLAQAVGREREAREDPLDLIRLFDLQQRLRNEQLRAKEFELSRARTMLSAARARAISDRAIENARESIATRDADKLRALGITRRQAGRVFEDFAETQGFAMSGDEGIRLSLKSLPVKGDVRTDAEVIFRDLIGRAEQDPALIDRTLVNLATPKTTAAQRKRTEEEQATQNVIKAIEEGDVETALKGFTDALSFEKQLLFIIGQTGNRELIDAANTMQAGFVPQRVGGVQLSTESSGGIEAAEASIEEALRNLPK